MKTIRQQIASLPEPYRSMAEKYEKKQGWDLPINWDEHNDFAPSFSWLNSEEGHDFWVCVYMHLLDPSNPLPPLPTEK